MSRSKVIQGGILATLVVAGFGFYMFARPFISGVAPLVQPAPVLPASSEALPFSLPEGFAASVYARDLPGARVLTRDPRGILIVSLPSEGKVVALPDENADGKAEKAVTILENLRKPHGIVFRCGAVGPVDGDLNDCTLYVAEENAVRAYKYDSQKMTASSGEKIADLPSGGGHSSRSFFLHPDGKRLLVAVGSSCNVCTEKDSRRAAVLSIDMGSKKVETFATGLRNTVFMAINPVDGAIWGTDMGRDLLGDDTPPDEINIIAEGKNYGWPNCYGKNIHDTDFDKKTYIRNPCMVPLETSSHIDIQAHSAPLGLAFIPEEGWPDGYGNDLLVAYHGSWNRSIPTGYKIVRYHLDNKGNQVGEASDFMTGFTTADGKVIGRPVALLAEPGGTLFVSDDRAGAVYRIVRK